MSSERLESAVPSLLYFGAQFARVRELSMTATWVTKVNEDRCTPSISIYVNKSTLRPIVTCFQESKAQQVRKAGKKSRYLRGAG